MSLPIGGVADKMGNIYEIYAVIRELLRLMNHKDEVEYVQYEEISEDKGVDFIVGYKDKSIEYVQCKSGYKNDAKWNHSTLISIISKWKSMFYSQSYKFRIVSPLESPEMKEIKLKGKYRENIEYSSDAEKLINNFIAKTCTDSNKDYSVKMADAISVLNRVTVDVSSNSALEEIILTKFEYLFRGDPNLNFKNLIGELISGQHYGKKLSVLDFKNILGVLNIELNDLSDNKSLLAQIDIINERYKSEYNKIDDKLIFNDDLDNIIRKVYDNEISIIYGRAGIGKSGVCLQLIQHCKHNHLPYIAVELDIHKFKDNLAKWSESLELPNNIVYCLNAVSGDKDSLIIIDQVDSIHSFDNDYKIAREICREIIRKIKVINNEQLNYGRKCVFHVVFVSREYDFKNDSIVSGIYTDKSNVRNYTEIEIKELNDKNVRKIIGDEYNVLNSNTKELLRTYNNIYIYKKIKNKHNNYLSTNDLIQKWCIQINEELKRQGCDVNVVDEIYSEIKNQYLYKDIYYIKKEDLKHKNKKELDYLLSEGIIIEREEKISFEHQTILDYFVSKELYHALGKGSADAINEIQKIGIDKLRNRYLLVLALQDILISDTEKFIEIADKILNAKEELHFFIKTVVLEILSMHSISKNLKIIDYVKNKIKNNEWSNYFINLVVPSNYEYIYSLLKDGYLKKMFDREKTSKNAIMLLTSISDDLDKNFDNIINDNIFKYSNLTNEWRWVFTKDITLDTDDFFELRIEYYRKYPDSIHTINFKNLFQSASERIIDIFDLLFDTRTRIKESYIYSLFDECDELGEQFYEANYKTIIGRLLKYVPTELPQFIGMSNWCATYFHSESIERILVEILKKSSVYMFRQDYNLFIKTFRKFFDLKNDIFNEIILFALIENVGNDDEKIVNIIVDYFDSIIFSQTFNGNDKLLLIKELISNISKSCNQDSFDKLEKIIINYKDTEIIENKKRLSKECSFNFPIYGYLQIDLLPCLDNKRLTNKSIELIKELKRKKLYNNRFAGDNFQSGITQSPLSGKNISINSWFNLITTHKIGRGSPKFFKGKFIDSSPQLLSYDFEGFVSTHLHECIDKFYRINDYTKINCYYISAFFRAIKNNEKILQEDYGKIVQIIKSSYRYIDDGAKCNFLELLETLMNIRLDNYILAIIYDEIYNGSWIYDINEPMDYMMSGYNLACCVAMRILINLYYIYRDKINLNDRYSYDSFLDEFRNSNNNLKLYWIIPIYDSLYYYSKESKYLDKMLNILNYDIKFLAYNNIDKLLVAMYKYKKFKVIKLVLCAAKIDNEYLNKAISIFLINLIYTDNNVVPNLILKLCKSKGLITCLSRDIVSYIKNEKLKDKLLRFLSYNIDIFIEDDIYLNRILYEKMISINEHKKIILKMLNPKYFRRNIESFIELVEGINVGDSINLIYKILNNYYLSSLYKEDYYSDKVIISFLNRILSTNIISKNTYHKKMLDLYDMVIMRSSACCRFSYTL